MTGSLKVIVIGIGVPAPVDPGPCVEDTPATVGGVVSMTMFGLPGHPCRSSAGSVRPRCPPRPGSCRLECQGRGRGIIQVGSVVSRRDGVGEGEGGRAAPADISGHGAAPCIQRQLRRPRHIDRDRLAEGDRDGDRRPRRRLPSSLSRKRPVTVGVVSMTMFLLAKPSVPVAGRVSGAGWLPRPG